MTGEHLRGAGPGACIPAVGNGSHLLAGAGSRGRERGEKKAKPRRGAKKKRKERSRGLKEELGAERQQRAGTRTGRQPTDAEQRTGGWEAAGGRCGTRLQPRGGGLPAGEGFDTAPRQLGSPRALWCCGGNWLQLAAFERGQRSPPAPALGWHEEPADPSLHLLEPGAGKPPYSHPRARGEG